MFQQSVKIYRSDRRTGTSFARGELEVLTRQAEQDWDFYDPWLYYEGGGGVPILPCGSYLNTQTGKYINFDGQGGVTITDVPLYEPDMYGTYELPAVEITYSAREARKEAFENSIRDRGGFTDHWLGGAFVDFIKLGPVAGATGSIAKGGISITASMVRREVAKGGVQA